MTAYTTFLPPETWLVVIEFLAVTFPKFNSKEESSESEAIILKSSPYIRTVSVLSRFFHQLTDPYRFREVHLMVDLSSRSLAIKRRRIGELLDLLELRPEVKSWIHVLSIGRDSRPPGGRRSIFDEYLPIEPRILKLLPELRSLTSLRSGHMPFSSALFSGILQLPRLERLEFDDFQLSQSPSDDTSNWDAIAQHGTSLRYLVVKALGSPTAPTTSAMIHLLQQDTLAELTYWPHLFPELQRGGSLLWIISNHIPEYVFTGLRRLHIMLPPSDAEVQHFVQLGARCPNLRSLALSWNFLDSPREMEDRLRRSGLEQHHFPALQHFDGPFALAPAFTSGRPVRTVISDMFTQLQGTDRDGNGASLVANIAALKPSVPLRMLHLVVSRWSDGDIEAVAQHHQELEELVYECLVEEPMSWSTRLEEAFKNLTKLKSLCLENTENEIAIIGLDDEHHLITQLRKSCPSLRWISISWLGTWKFRDERKDQTSMMRMGLGYLEL